MHLFSVLILLSFETVLKRQMWVEANIGCLGLEGGSVFSLLHFFSMVFGQQGFDQRNHQRFVSNRKAA